jgi:ATP-binding cassette, subfamily B, bacterial
MPSFWDRVKLTLRMAYRADRFRTIAVFCLSILQQAQTVVIALVLRSVVQAALTRSRDLVPYAIALAVLTALGFLLNRWAINVFVVLNERNIEQWNRELIELSASIGGVEHYENPSYLNQLELVRGQPTAIGLVPGSIAWVVGSIALLVGSLVIFGFLEPILLVLPLFALPSVIAVRQAESASQRTMARTSEQRRVANDLFEQATAPAAGKELRVLRAEEELIRRHRASLGQVNSELARTDLHNALMVSGARLLFSAAYVLGLFFVIAEGIRGRLSAGDIVLTVFLATSISAQVRLTIDGLRRALNGLSILDRVYWLYDFADRHRPRRSEFVPVPERLRRGISLDHVSFSYPDTERSVLVDVSLDIPAGAVVAVVGDNGAGKSSLVKLLMGMYEPTTGLIAIDGIALGDLDPGAWRRRTSAAFQDFCRLELSLQEAVGVGDVEHLGAEELVRSALEKSGGGTLVGQLPEGLRTQLGSSFGGIDLSGGQWQRVALARTVMRTTPLLLVLDEPTASLDPGSERDVFDRYSALARQASTATGGITLLITHRFSTVRTADLIVVLKEGRVIETGSHTQLVAAGGEYAVLYEMQASHYR